MTIAIQTRGDVTHRCLKLCDRTACPSVVEPAAHVPIVVHSSLQENLNNIEGRHSYERLERGATLALPNIAPKLYDGGTVWDPRAKEWVT
jgi:hypothetical protein